MLARGRSMPFDFHEKRKCGGGAPLGYSAPWKPGISFRWRVGGPRHFWKPTETLYRISSYSPRKIPELRRLRIQRYKRRCFCDPRSKDSKLRTPAELTIVGAQFSLHRLVEILVARGHGTKTRSKSIQKEWIAMQPTKFTRYQLGLSGGKELHAGCLGTAV